MTENIDKEDIEKIMKMQERIIKIQEKQSQRLGVLEKKIETLEGLDISKYLKEDTEVDEVIDERISNLLEIANKLQNVNKYKRDSIMDYMSKKSGVGKTDLAKVLKAFEQYLEKLL